jgi:hypothetical protein
VESGDDDLKFVRAAAGDAPAGDGEHISRAACSVTGRCRTRLLPP